MYSDDEEVDSSVVMDIGARLQLRFTEDNNILVFSRNCIRVVAGGSG